MTEHPAIIPSHERILSPRAWALAVTLAASIFANDVLARDSDSLFLIELAGASRYLSEAELRYDAGVYGVSLSLSRPDLPVYAKLSTLRGSDEYHEDEISLAYAYSYGGNRFLLGASYSSEVAQQPLLVPSQDEQGSINGYNPMTRDNIDESGEIFVRFDSEEFYFTRMILQYTLDFENRGSLINLEFDLRYPINNVFSVGAGLKSGFNNGYLGISGLNGLYHIDYKALVDIQFVSKLGMEIMAIFSVPYRSAIRLGVSDEVVYRVNFYYSFF